jgi:hypothetical protein
MIIKINSNVKEKEVAKILKGIANDFEKDVTVTILKDTKGNDCGYIDYGDIFDFEDYTKDEDGNPLWNEGDN